MQLYSSRDCLHLNSMLWLFRPPENFKCKKILKKIVISKLDYKQKVQYMATQPLLLVNFPMSFVTADSKVTMNISNENCFFKFIYLLKNLIKCFYTKEVMANRICLCLLVHIISLQLYQKHIHRNNK